MAWRAPSTPKHLRRGLHQRSPFRSFLFRCPPGPPVTLGCEIRKVIRFRNWDFDYIYHLINHINSHICIYLHHFVLPLLYYYYHDNCSSIFVLLQPKKDVSSYAQLLEGTPNFGTNPFIDVLSRPRMHSGHPLWCYDCPILFVATWFSVKEDCGFSSLETFPETMSSRIPNARL
jgi:hypothetical protein